MNKLIAYPQSKLIFWIIISLLLGFFLGIEYKSYQIQKNLQTFEESLNQISPEDNNESDKVKEAETLSEEEKNNYIPKIDISIKIEEFESIIDSENIFNGKARGLVGTIKNNGDKEIKKVELLVIFLNENDQSIYEYTYNPLYNMDTLENVILKPNYINEFAFNTNGVPKEWSGKIKYEISDIEY